MFANVVWSALILAGLIGMYVLIRIKHQGPLLAVDMTWKEWVVRFRTWVAALVTGLALALPDILVTVAPFDFSPWIGDTYAKVVTLMFGIFMAINASLKTKPDGQKGG